MLLRIGLTILLLSAALLAGQAGSPESDGRIQSLYAAAKAAQAQGDLQTATAKYEAILRIAPKLAPAYNNLGTLYFRQREYAKAATVLEQGLKVDPSMASASALLGISLYEMGEYAKARLPLETALHKSPTDRNALLYLVKDLTKLGDFEQAASHLQTLAIQQPKDQEVWYLLSKVYMKLSESALAKMNQIDPDSVLAHQLSAEVMESMNNYDGAVVELKKAVERAPGLAGNHYKLGDAFWNLRQWDSAAEEFQKELNVDGGNCSVHWKLGDIVLQKNGSAADALQHVEAALALCPGLTEARVDRARALAKLNRNEDAVADLLRAEQANPDDPDIHFLLAKVYRTLGKAQEAQAEMRIFSKLEESARAATAERAQEVIKNKEGAH